MGEDTHVIQGVQRYYGRSTRTDQALYMPGGLRVRVEVCGRIRIPVIATAKLLGASRRSNLQIVIAGHCRFLYWFMYSWIVAFKRFWVGGGFLP